MNTKIYKADAFELLPSLETDSVDLILTDPPYNFDKGQKEFLHMHMMRISKTGVMVFSPPENQWVLPADQYLFWIKPTSTKNTSRKYSRFVEMIFLYGELKWNAGHHWSRYTNVFFDLVDNTNGHNFRKPPSLIERLLLNHANERDMILDPFAGSGVVREVAERLNMNTMLYDKMFGE